MGLRIVTVVVTDFDQTWEVRINVNEKILNPASQLPVAIVSVIEGVSNSCGTTSMPSRRRIDRNVFSVRLCVS